MASRPVRRAETAVERVWGVTCRCCASRRTGASVGSRARVGWCVEEQEDCNSRVRFRRRQRGESWMLIEYDGPSQVMDERRGPEQ